MTCLREPTQRGGLTVISTLPGLDWRPAQPVKPETRTCEVRVRELLRWSTPKTIHTDDGPYELRTARPCGSFWSTWRANTELLREQGVNVTKNPAGAWLVTWRRALSADELAEQRSVVEQSRALCDDLEVPCPEGVTYMPFQRAGVAFALAHDNVLIADEPGLGKSAEAIGVANIDTSMRNVLVICPASIKINWQREWAKWGTTGLSTGIVYGSDVPDTDVVIVNYDILKRNHAALRRRSWDMLIADECHRLKNKATHWTAEVLGRRRNGEKQAVSPIVARRRVFMTGTPIVNKPADLWTLVHALDPRGLGANWRDFMVRYADGHETRFGWDTSGASHLDELQSRLRQFTVRRLKSEVLTELPAKTRQIVELDVPRAARKLLQAELDVFDRYEKATEALHAESRRAPGATMEVHDYLAAVAALEEERQTAFTAMSKARHEVAVAKVPAVVEYLADALDSLDKIIVFAHHRDVISALCEAFAGQCVSLTGDTAPVKRQEAVDRFQSDPAVRVFIGNIQAAGVGLNLTAAHAVYFAELPWTPMELTQAEDRAHRIGQHDNVHVTHLVLNGSLDARMAKMLVAKQEVSDMALDAEAPS